MIFAYVDWDESINGMTRPKLHILFNSWYPWGLAANSEFLMRTQFQSTSGAWFGLVLWHSGKGSCSFSPMPFSWPRTAFVCCVGSFACASILCTWNFGSRKRHGEKEAGVPLPPALQSPQCLRVLTVCFLLFLPVLFNNTEGGDLQCDGFSSGQDSRDGYC